MLSILCPKLIRVNSSGTCQWMNSWYKFCFIFWLIITIYLWLLIKFAYNPQLRRNGHYSLEHPPNERSRYRMQKCYCAPISQATPDHLWFDVLFEVNRTSYPSYYLLLGFSFLRLLIDNEHMRSYKLQNSFVLSN